MNSRTALLVDGMSMLRRVWGYKGFVFLLSASVSRMLSMKHLRKRVVPCMTKAYVESLRMLRVVRVGSRSLVMMPSRVSDLGLLYSDSS